MCLYLDNPLHYLDHEGRPQALFSHSHSLLQESIVKSGDLRNEPMSLETRSLVFTI